MPLQPLEGGVCIYVHSPGKGCAKRPENDRLQLQHVHNSSSHAGKRGAGCTHTVSSCSIVNATIQHSLNFYLNLSLHVNSILKCVFKCFA